MKNFKIDILKRGFERFQKENLVEILKCGYCQKNVNLGIKTFQFYREAFCKPCHNFNIAKETLTKGVDAVAKDYIEHFIKDFLCISNQTLETNFQVSEIVCVPVEKTLNVKSYHKNDKKRSQVVYKKFDNCEKLSYTVSKRKTTNVLQKILIYFRS